MSSESSPITADTVVQAISLEIQQVKERQQNLDQRVAKLLRQSLTLQTTLERKIEDLCYQQFVAEELIRNAPPPLQSRLPGASNFHLQSPGLRQQFVEHIKCCHTCNCSDNASPESSEEEQSKQGV